MSDADSSPSSSPPRLPSPADQQAAPPPIGSVPPPLAQTQAEVNNWAMLTHLSGLVNLFVPPIGTLGPLILWAFKKEQIPQLEPHFKEATNFQITALIALSISAILLFVVIGVILLPVIGIASLILTVIGGLKASKGELYRYPLTIRFLK